MRTEAGTLLGIEKACSFIERKDLFDVKGIDLDPISGIQARQLWQAAQRLPILCVLRHVASEYTLVTASTLRTPDCRESRTTASDARSKGEAPAPPESMAQVLFHVGKECLARQVTNVSFDLTEWRTTRSGHNALNNNQRFLAIH